MASVQRISSVLWSEGTQVAGTPASFCKRGMWARQGMRKSLRLFSRHAGDADLGHLVVPVDRHGLEGQAELAFVTGFERRGTDGHGIDIWLVGAGQGGGGGFGLGGGV